MKSKSTKTSKKYNPWDAFPGFYNTFKKDIWYGAADNIETVWPEIIKLIKKYFPKKKGLKALDFGCGSGMFCNELKKLGFDTTGIDTSSHLIKIGKKNLDSDIKLLVGDAKKAKAVSKASRKFDLITSIMCLQFVNNSQVSALADALNKNGYLIIANHNPERLKETGVKNHILFTDTSIKTPVYPRSPSGYDSIFRTHGITRISDMYIKQNKKFLKSYKINKITKNPKYMILVYKKS